MNSKLRPCGSPRGFPGGLLAGTARRIFSRLSALQYHRRRDERLWLARPSDRDRQTARVPSAPAHSILRLSRDLPAPLFPTYLGMRAQGSTWDVFVRRIDDTAARQSLDRASHLVP